MVTLFLLNETPKILLIILQKGLCRETVTVEEKEIIPRI